MSTLAGLVLAAVFVQGEGTAFTDQQFRRLQFIQIFDGYQAGFVLKPVGENKVFRWDPKITGQRMAPGATFEIPAALVALDAGLVADPNRPIPWDKQPQPVAAWAKDHSLRTAMHASVGWVFKSVAGRIGEERMSTYLSNFGYGNAAAAAPFTNSGASHALRVSMDEQVDFLENLYIGRLPVTERAVRALEASLPTTRGRNYTIKEKVATNYLNGAKWEGLVVGHLTVGGKDYVYATYVRPKRPTPWEGPKARARRLKMKHRDTAEGADAQRATRRIFQDLGLLPRVP